MCTYDEAMQIVDRAFDDKIIKVIERIDRSAISRAIDDAELRSILAFLLDINYYRRTYGDSPLDSDMVNFITTRFAHSLPRQELNQINEQRSAIQIQLYDAEFTATRAMDNLFTGLISQIGIPLDSNIESLKATFQQEHINFDIVIDLLVDFGARLPAPALVHNLGLFFRDIQRIHDALHIELQNILDQHIAIADERESDFSESEEMSFDSDNESLVNTTCTEDSTLSIGLNGAFFYNDDTSF